jgi:hypothetical protein
MEFSMALELPEMFLKIQFFLKMGCRSYNELGFTQGMQLGTGEIYLPAYTETTVAVGADKVYL